MVSAAKGYFGLVTPPEVAAAASRRTLALTEGYGVPQVMPLLLVSPTHMC
jgi:hypothetical protein